MRLAIIDLGTNSVRFDVHELSGQGEVYALHKEKLMIRLGEGVFIHHRLSPKSIRLCVEAFQSFKKTIHDFRVHRVVAFGTAALREVKDAERLIKKIKRECGISVKIISGDEEAALIARGVLENQRAQRGQFALVDIGGGSTEVTVCSGRRVLHSASFPLGTARLQQVFLKNIPPVLLPSHRHGIHPIEHLRRHIRGVLLYKVVSEDWKKTRRLMGSSGTIRAIAKVIKRRTDREVFSKKDLDELVEEMKTMNRAQLSAIPGMEIRRVDMILGGAILLQETMSALHAVEVETTEFSLRDGILDQEIEWLAEEKKKFQYKPLDDLFDTAKDFGIAESALNANLKIAETFFDVLKPIHHLNDSWKLYLLSASLLHDTGRVISPIDSEFHSAYVAQFADVPAFDDWESKMIAELCFYAKDGGKIDKKDIPFKKNERNRRAFLKLLAILRLVTAFSFQRTTPVSLERAKLKGRRLHLLVSPRAHPELGILRADQKKSLFEDLFKKQIVFERT